MTISTSVGVEFDVKKLVTMAYRKAGLLNPQQTPQNPEIGHGKDELALAIHAMSARGAQARARRFEDVLMVVGQTTYGMPAGTQDVIGDGKLIPAGQTPSAADGELFVRQVRREEWHVVSGKSAVGTPSIFYTDRDAIVPQVVVWPIPGQADTIRFPCHRLLADVWDGNATVDLQHYWYDYLVKELAARLATSHNLPIPRVDKLGMEAKVAFTHARRHSMQRTDVRMNIDHSRQR